MEWDCAAGIAGSRSHRREAVALPGPWPRGNGAEISTASRLWIPRINRWLAGFRGISLEATEECFEKISSAGEEDEPNGCVYQHNFYEENSIFREAQCVIPLKLV